MQKWPIAKILLTWSLILFLIPLIDSFATGLREEQKSLSHFNWEFFQARVQGYIPLHSTIILHSEYTEVLLHY